MTTPSQERKHVFRTLEEALRASSIPSLLKNEVIQKLRDREWKGLQTYGESLTTNNNRNAIKDLEEELLDALAYAEQAELEGSFLGGTREKILDALLTLLDNQGYATEQGTLFKEES